MVISGITLYATKKRKTPPLDFPAGDYEQLCRQHFAAKESQEISPTEWNDSKDTFQGKFGFIAWKGTLFWSGNDKYFKFQTMS